MTIPKEQARRIFTEGFLGVYREQTPSSNFMKSFFRNHTTPDKMLSIEVERNTERIAVDVIRGTNANRNTFSRFSEKKYQPPFYNEGFDATSLDRYDIAIGQAGAPTQETINTVARNITGKLEELRKKIERAKEKQASQVLETGVVELENNDSVDYKRKADSMVDLSANPWSTTGAPVEQQLIDGGDWIRKNGKNAAKTLNLIMSSDAWVDLKKTDYFKNNAAYQQVSLVDVNMPQVDIGGSVFHGRIVAGGYTLNVWTYDETYEDKSGNTQYYWPRDYAVMVPERGTDFVMAHAGVPAIIADQGNAEFSQYIASMEAMYWVNNFIDMNRKAHIFELYSAPLAIPVTVDMIYTMKVLSGTTEG